MRIQFLIFLISYFLITIVNGASKYYDGPIRPYEFGYSIEGNQHRQEKKDENGIIMGEFGFITADGVYHVTVYATDENGNFKILSMKNIKIGLPEETKGARTSPSAAGSATTNAPLSTINLPTKPQLTTKKRKPGAATSCSSCLIPKAQQPDEDNSEDQINFDVRSNAETTQNSSGKGSNALQPPKGSSGSGNNLFNPLTKKLNNNAGGSRLNTQGQAPQSSIGSFASSDGTTTQQQQGKVSRTGSPVDGGNLPSNRKSPGQGQQSLSGGRNQVSTPSLSGEPPLGKSVGEGGGILYKFNYTVGYHGHHEQGDYEGIKDGGYNFVGRDGLRRTIDYLANEFGYQPYLTLDKVDEKDIPKPETEKEAGLKGYEFKWFNKPKQ